jgi:glycosyltransferase involved in cell wall biosynthesis
MLNIYFPGPPLHWKNGIAIARKLRILYKPNEVKYYLNVKKFEISFSLLIGVRLSKMILEKISSNLPILFYSGYGGKEIILDNKIDIVHTIVQHVGKLIKYNKPTLYELDIAPIEYFHFYEGIPIPKLMSLYKYFRNLFKDQRNLLVVWQTSSVYLLRKLGFDENKINYVPPPIPLIKRNKEVSNEEPKLLFVGYDYYLKGGDIALKAFEIINKEIPKSKLLFISKNKPPVKFCNVIYIGVIDNEILKREILPSVDIFLCPFRFKRPSGMSILEAFSAGVPVISTYHPLLEDYVIDGFNGYSVKEYNAKNFAEKAIELLQDKNRLKNMSKNAIKYINDNYSPKYVASKLLKLYKYLIENK